MPNCPPKVRALILTIKRQFNDLVPAQVERWQVEVVDFNHVSDGHPVHVTRSVRENVLCLKVEPHTEHAVCLALQNDSDLSQ